MKRAKTKSKSIFVRGVECQVCHRIGSLQILGKYYRIRHYEKLVNGKSQFTYHRNDRDYIERILADQNVKANADQIQTTKHSTPDLKLKDSRLNIFTKNNYANALEKFS